MQFCKTCRVRIHAYAASGLCRKHYSESRIGLPMERLSADDLANRRVSRDPCTYCGVRGDLGCRHRKVAA